MTIVSNSKCSKCHKVQHVSQLKENPDAIGLICKDEVKCKVKIAEVSKAAVSNTQGLE